VAFRLAADLTVAVHLAFVAFLLAGGFIAWRRPRVLRLHVPAAAVSAGLALTGLDCPLTDLEQWLRRRGGEAAYRGGFVAHYLVRPLHPAGMTPTISVGLRILSVSVVAVAYLGLLVQRRRARPTARHSREHVSASDRSYAS
jgi:hypothetical protein